MSGIRYVIEERKSGWLRFRVCWTFGLDNHPCSPMRYRSRKRARAVVDRKTWTQIEPTRPTSEVTE